MRGVLPGSPQSKLEAVDTALWNGRRIVTYISGNALIILRGPNDLLQTILSAEDDVLHAVSIDSATGKIATSSGKAVHIYRPIGQGARDLKWALQASFELEDEEHAATCLSWGLPDEVLIGSTYLTLLSTDAGLKVQWRSKKLANPVKHALFSHDASLIASCGWRDRLVKIWRRGFIGGGYERFDPVYLAHPAAVTNLKWRGRSHEDQHWDAVLYTTCADGRLRVWTAQDPHCLQILQLWAEIDLTQSIQPRSPLSPSPFKKRYVIMVDQWEFSTAVDGARRSSSKSERELHTRENLKDVASRGTEVCIIIDDRGNMSAWGLERVGCKARQAKDVLNIANAEDLDIAFPQGAANGEDYLQCYSFASGQTPGALTILFHFFDGRLQWLESPVDQLLDPSPSPHCLTMQAELTGHADSIARVICSSDKQTALSLAHSGHFIVWAYGHGEASTALTRRSVGKLRSDHQEVQDVRLIWSGDYAVFLAGDMIQVWDVRQERASPVARLASPAPHDSFAFGVPSSDEKVSPVFMPLISAAVDPIIIRLDLSNDLARLTTKTAKRSSTITNGHSISPPKGSKHKQALSFDTLLSCNENAVLEISHRDASNETLWRPMMTFDTIDEAASIVKANSHGLVAVVDEERRALSIWNPASCHHEFTCYFDRYDHRVQSLQWTMTPSCEPVLAVASSRRIQLFAQTRCSYAEMESASWTCVKTFGLADMTTMPISDFAWAKGEDLVVAAGSQIFIFDTGLDLDNNTRAIRSAPSKRSSHYSLSDAMQIRDHMLPTYHPEVVSQLICTGRLDVVRQMFRILQEKLKYFTEGEGLDISLDQVVQTIPSNDKDDDSDQEDDAGGLSEDMIASLLEKIDSIKLPYLTTPDQNRLKTLVDSVGSLERHKSSVDGPGLQYLASLYQNTGPDKQQLAWRDLAWAYQSVSQDILLNQTSRQYASRLLWTHARATGLFMWTSDLATVRSQFELIARNEYSKTDERNPIDCSLHYLALQKKQVLIGLWRMATWHREQGMTQRLLSNNFDEPRWKTAALKNAYALLGRQRNEYAAAFFLLAGNLRDAVSVLAKQQQDLQLAIAVARVYEGDSGPVLRDLLTDTVLSAAAHRGDRYMAAWAFQLLNRRDLAMSALALPIPTLHLVVRDFVNTSPRDPTISQQPPEIPLPPIAARSWPADDPAAAALYAHLRDTTPPPDPTKPSPPQRLPSPADEHAFVLRCAQAYMRSGCGELALALLRDWRFSEPQKTSAERGARGTDDAVALDGAAEAGADGQGEAEAELLDTAALAGRKKVVEEPSAASILDNFDF